DVHQGHQVVGKISCSVHAEKQTEEDNMTAGENHGKIPQWRASRRTASLQSNGPRHQQQVNSIWTTVARHRLDAWFLVPPKHPHIQGRPFGVRWPDTALDAWIFWLPTIIHTSKAVSLHRTPKAAQQRCSVPD